MINMSDMVSKVDVISTKGKRYKGRENVKKGNQIVYISISGTLTDGIICVTGAFVEASIGSAGAMALWISGRFW